MEVEDHNLTPELIVELASQYRPFELLRVQLDQVQRLFAVDSRGGLNGPYGLRLLVSSGALLLSRIGGVSFDL
ncbi:MAG: hypothetical protein GY926_17980 [bacterium]|nr:hypothetical protein [bacterium]